jgi:prophage antirepressor-like protein
MSHTFIDILNNILEYNDNKITIIIDDDMMPWFSASNVADVLQYVNKKKIISRNVDPRDKKQFADLKEFVNIIPKMNNLMPFILMSPDYIV